MMANIIINTKEYLTLNDLEYSVMRYVWERQTMSSSEVKAIFTTLRYFKDESERTINKSLLYVITQLAKIIMWCDQGKYDRQRALYKEHKIDWKKVYKLPGAHTSKDFFIAQKNYERYKREHPETEQTGNPN